MAYKNHSPGGGKTNCASVEEILLYSTAFEIQQAPSSSELLNLKVTPELTITEQQDCTGTGRQTFPCLESHVLQLPWLPALLQNFAVFLHDPDVLIHLLLVYFLCSQPLLNPPLLRACSSEHPLSLWEVVTRAASPSPSHGPEVLTAERGHKFGIFLSAIYWSSVCFLIAQF